MRAALSMMEDAGVGLIVGLPGGGKSLYLTQLIDMLPGWVFGNLDILPAHPSFNRYVRLGKSVGMPIWDWENEDSWGIDKLPRGSAEVPVNIIIDEAHILFHQFVFSKAPFKLQRRWVEYISTHRKRYHRLFFSTQKVSKIWKEIRNVSQFCVVCFDEAKIPSLLQYLPKSLIPFKRVLFPDDSLNPSEIMAVDRLTRAQAKYLFPLYNTRQIDHD